MRIGVVAAAVCLCIVGFANADDVRASLRKPTDIPAQGLAPALTTLAKQFDFQVLYKTEIVQGRKSPGVSGAVTAGEALEHLLSGTGLTYKYLDERTVTIYPVTAGLLLQAQKDPEAAVADKSSEAERAKEGKSNSSQGFRLAQVDQGKGANASPVENRTLKESPELEEVVVTARKKSESIQDVPISMAAVSAQTLRSRDANTITDIAATIPGLQVNSQTGQPGSVNITLRGITTADITSTTTAITVDDVPVGSSTAYAYAALSNVDLLPYDLDHVEVLYGPQGTLYGASSLGGLVKYVTTTPDLDHLSGRLGGSVAAIDRAGNPEASARVELNVPLVPGQLAFSVGGGYSYRPGYIDNLATGQKNFNPGNQDNARLTLYWKPDDRFTAKITGLYNRSDFDGVGTDAYDVATNRPVYGYYDNFFHKPFEDLRETGLFIADLSYRFDFATLTSVSGYSYEKGRVTYDASEIPFYQTNYEANGILVPGQLTSRNNRVTQEFRLASPTEQSLQWLVGAFYNRERTRYDEYINAIYKATNQIVPALAPFYNNDSPSGFQEEAAFGNLNYRITDAWDVGAGVRYSHNSQHVSADTIGSLVGGGGATPEFHSSDHSITYAFDTRYHLTPEAMLYARIATGYRPGGANTAAGVPPTFKPDTTTNYEFGIKSDWLDRRLRVNLAAFLIDWTDIHLTDRLANQIPFTGNAGKARSQGLELNTSYEIISDLRVGVVAAYTDAYLQTDAPAVGASAGDPLPNTPKWSGLVNADWGHALSAGYTARLNAAWRFVGNRVSNFPFGQGGSAALDAYHALDLTAGVETTHLHANLFVKNAFNKQAFLSYYNFGATILQPRTIGVSADYDF